MKPAALPSTAALGAALLLPRTGCRGGTADPDGAVADDDAPATKSTSRRRGDR